MNFKNISFITATSIRCIVLLVLFNVLTACQDDVRYKEILQNPQTFNATMKQLTDVIVYDIFSPPVASRIYMYPSVASYAIIQKKHPNKYNSLVGQLSGFKDISEPENK